MRTRNAVGTLVASALVALSCSTEPTPSAPSLTVSGDVPGALTVCKIGPAGTTATFSITHTGSGTLPLGTEFTIPATDQCIGGSNVAWVPGSPGDPPDSVIVTEVGATPGLSLQRIVTSGPSGLNAYQEIAPPQDWIVLVMDGVNEFMVGFKNDGVPGKTFTIGPSSMEGHLKIPINSWFNGGYSFKFKSNTHAATQFTVAAKVEVAVTCPYGGGPGGTILIPLGTVTYSVPAGNTNWLPTGDANNILSWMGAVRTPDLCGGFPMDNAKGAVFTATVSQNPVTGSLVDFRFKYRDPAAKGKLDTNCTDPNEPKRNDAATCGASWSQTVTDP